MTYYQTAALSSTRQLRRNQNAVRFRSNETKLGPISNALIIAVLVSVLGLVYLTQVTRTSSYSYEVSNLNNRKQELIESNRTLQVEAARLQALERIQTSEVAKGLESPSSVQYVR